MGWRIILWAVIALAAILIFVLILPVGIRLRYGQEGFKLWYAIGPIRFAYRPKKEKEHVQNAKPNISLRNFIGKADENTHKKDGVWGNFRTDLKTILAIFGYLRPKIRIKCFVLKLHLAGASPATMAIEYGGAWAAIGSFLPLMEEAFNLKKRELDVDCNFSGETTSLDARLDISIGLGRLLLCLIRYGMSTTENSEMKHTERR